MTILMKPANIGKGGTFNIGLNKLELSNHPFVLADAHFANTLNWKYISITFRSATGNQSKTLVFKANEIVPYGNMPMSDKARNGFFVENVTLFDHDGGALIITRTALLASANAADFDIDLSGSALFGKSELFTMQTSNQNMTSYLKLSKNEPEKLFIGLQASYKTDVYFNPAAVVIDPSTTAGTLDRTTSEYLNDTSVSTYTVRPDGLSAVVIGKFIVRYKSETLPPINPAYLYHDSVNRVLEVSLVDGAVQVLHDIQYGDMPQGASNIILDGNNAYISHSGGIYAANLATNTKMWSKTIITPNAGGYVAAKVSRQYKLQGNFIYIPLSTGAVTSSHNIKRIDKITGEYDNSIPEIMGPVSRVIAFDIDSLIYVENTGNDTFTVNLKNVPWGPVDIAVSTPSGSPDPKLAMANAFLSLLAAHPAYGNMLYYIDATIVGRTIVYKMKPTFTSGYDFADPTFSVGSMSFVTQSIYTNHAGSFLFEVSPTGNFIQFMSSTYEFLVWNGTSFTFVDAGRVAWHTCLAASGNILVLGQSNKSGDVHYNGGQPCVVEYDFSGNVVDTKVSNTVIAAAGFIWQIIYFPHMKQHNGYIYVTSSGIPVKRFLNGARDIAYTADVNNQSGAPSTFRFVQGKMYCENYSEANPHHYYPNRLGGTAFSAGAALIEVDTATKERREIATYITSERSMLTLTQYPTKFFNITSATIESFELSGANIVKDANTWPRTLGNAIGSTPAYDDGFIYLGNDHTYNIVPMSDADNAVAYQYEVATRVNVATKKLDASFIINSPFVNNGNVLSFSFTPTYIYIHLEVQYTGTSKIFRVHKATKAMTEVDLATLGYPLTETSRITVAPLSGGKIAIMRNWPKAGPGAQTRFGGLSYLVLDETTLALGVQPTSTLVPMRMTYDATNNVFLGVTANPANTNDRKFSKIDLNTGIGTELSPLLGLDYVNNLNSLEVGYTATNYVTDVNGNTFTDLQGVYNRKFYSGVVKMNPFGTVI
jgi:hypothetical protein